MCRRSANHANITVAFSDSTPHGSRKFLSFSGEGTQQTVSVTTLATVFNRSLGSFEGVSAVRAVDKSLTSMGFEFAFLTAIFLTPVIGQVGIATDFTDSGFVFPASIIGALSGAVTGSVLILRRAAALKRLLAILTGVVKHSTSSLVQHPFLSGQGGGCTHLFGS